MSKPFLVSTKIEVKPTLELATRILEHILVHDFEVPVDEVDVDLSLEVRDKIKVEGDIVSSNLEAAGILLALQCLKERQVILPKTIVSVMHEDGAFVIQVNGRVIRNFMEVAESSKANKMALRDMATISADVTRQAFQALGMEVELFIDDRVQNFKG